jgi:hypothetical protein
MMRGISATMDAVLEERAPLAEQDGTVAQSEVAGAEHCAKHSVGTTSAGTDASTLNSGGVRLASGAVPEPRAPDGLPCLEARCELQRKSVRVMRFVAAVGAMNTRRIIR